MRIRHLRLRINTDRGLHGTDIAFPDGLVVLWADNSMGKSTCIRAILVALGFEAMITASKQDLPLPPVMKAELMSDSYHAIVIQSDIFLELENSSGSRIVVHRAVKGTRSKDLITVTYGPALTQPTGSYKSEDFFVSRPGSALRERGFHYFLAEFLGWNLPSVQTYEGRQSPLYLQCIFPYVIVEQTRGWSNIDPPIPTQFGIKDPHKRSIEFILDLDAYRIAMRRMELDQQATEIQRNWSTVIGEMRATAQLIGGIVNNLPLKPVSTWPPEIPPIILLPQDQDWLTLDQVLNIKRKTLSDLVENEIPRVKDAASAAEFDLSQEQSKLYEREAILARLLESIEMERGEANSIAERMSKIEEDLQRHKDVKTLISLGSSTAPNIVAHVCPTCHQHLIDSLMPLAKEQNVMSIDDNISFLEEQRATFHAVLKNIEAVVEARQQQIANFRDEISSHRSHIRALKQTLVTDGRLPSKAAIQAQLELQLQIEHIERALEEFSMKSDELESLADSWAKLQTEKLGLPKEDASAEDHNKIVRWGNLLVEQLNQYDFQSLAPTKITISPYTYRPTHEGFDLPSNISASDFIRVIWAYLNGLLELSRYFATNHPGLLIFDEPKQQSAKKISFTELLKRASESGAFGQQVIFATSEDRQNLEDMLKNIAHEYIPFEGRIIRPLSN
jgi:hypothetical protein